MATRNRQVKWAKPVHDGSKVIRTSKCNRVKAATTEPIVKLTAPQEKVFRATAGAGGRPRSFEGPQLRVADSLLERGLFKRALMSYGFVLTAAGEQLARSLGWLKERKGRPS